MSLLFVCVCVCVFLMIISYYGFLYEKYDDIIACFLCESVQAFVITRNFLFPMSLISSDSFLSLSLSLSLSLFIDRLREIKRNLF